MYPHMKWLFRQPFHKAVRHYAKQSEREINRLVKIKDLDQDTVETPLFTLIVDAVMDKMWDRKDLESENETHLLTIIDAAYQLVLHIREGGQIYQLSPDLSQILTRTDLQDVEADEIHMPYKSIYIRFEEPQSMSGTAIDGVLLSRNDLVEGSFILTVFPVDLARFHNVNIHRYEFVLAPGSTVIESLDVMRRVVEIERADDKERLWDGFNEHAERLRHLLEIALNTLLFIDNCNDGMRQEWPDHAKQSDVEKARGSGPAAKSAQKRLQSKHTRIWRLDVTKSEKSELSAKGETPSTHWRRGHWRRQRHGEGNALTKRIRIAPTIVGKGSPLNSNRTYKLTPPRR